MGAKQKPFLFGPVDSQGIDPAMDSWPVNRTDLDAVLNGSNTLDIPFVTALDDTLCTASIPLSI